MVPEPAAEVLVSGVLPSALALADGFGFGLSEIGFVVEFDAEIVVVAAAAAAEPVDTAAGGTVAAADIHRNQSVVA